MAAGPAPAAFDGIDQGQSIPIAQRNDVGIIGIRAHAAGALADRLDRAVADDSEVARDHGVKLASLLPMYRWASPDEDERQAAVKYWKVAIQVAIDMECDTLNSEFGRGCAPDGRVAVCGGGGTTEAREAAWWKSMEELVPIFERSAEG